jgi:polyphosphate:AMP phosphotransferase
MRDLLTPLAKTSKADFDAAEPELRVELLNAQFDLHSTRRNVVVLIAGNDRRGCNAVLNRLHAWLDARYLNTYAFEPRTPDEKERPYFWRYWRAMPPRGRIGIFLHAWTFSTLAARVNRKISRKELARRLDHINRFEHLLTDDGTILLKYWLHLPEREVRKRLDRADDGDADWHFSKAERRVFADPERVEKVARQMMAATNTPAAEWCVLDSANRRARDLHIARTIRDRLIATPAADTTAELAESADAPSAKSIDGTTTSTQVNVLDAIDLTQALPDDVYDKALDHWQARLNRLSLRARRKGVATVLVFEGADAAGKGGAIRRLTAAMDATHYRVIPIAAPTTEEHAQHYLWRFWRHLPRAGRMTIFDRSWYGRVLVERVEGFATEAEWRRAYGEINHFERQLTEQGVVVRKFWLHIDEQEQLRRFTAREKTAYKKHKITAEDYRNRQKLSAYRTAAHDMITRTNTPAAPWQLVAANDKRHARITVITAVCEALAQAVD